MGGDLSDEDSDILDNGDSGGPLLLRGLTKSLRVEDVLQAVPSRQLTDRLVHSYFAAKDHSAGKWNCSPEQPNTS